MRIAILALVPLCFGAGCLVAGLRAAHAQAAPAAVTVTSDSASYCDDLARRLPQAASVEVARLWREGKTMCDQGHVRSGIMQLRRALQLARAEKKDTP